MIAVYSTLIVFTVSLIVIRVATVGLAMTGLSKDLSHFQALSAFTGSGFTTKESEDIVNHPVRRRIVMHLMLLGHVGVVLAIPSVVLSFLNTDAASGQWSSHISFRMAVMGGGLFLLYLIANNRHVERLMWNLNSWALERVGKLQVHDYTRLLRVGRDYVISELQVRGGEWIADHTLQELALNHEGMLVLGVERSNGEYVGAPRGSTRLHAGDSLVLYGRHESLVALAERQAGMEGNIEHMLAVTRQLDVKEAEASGETASGEMRD